MTPHPGFKAFVLYGALALAVIHIGTQVLSAQTIQPGIITVEEEGSSSASSTDSSEGTDDSLPTGRRLDVLLASLSIFVLAIFVGFEVITKVPPTLHTPLMSGSNAISGITLVGALLVAGTGKSDVASWLGGLAVVFATVNVVGGFWVTHRMLSMFKRK